MELRQLSQLTKAVIEPEGSDLFDHLEISGAAGLDIAQPGQVTFLANPKYVSQVSATKASAIYVGEGVKVKAELVILRTADPYLAYTRALQLFHPEPTYSPGIHPTATIDPTAQIADSVSIGAYSVIGARVQLATGARVFPNVTIYEGARIGENSVLHSGVSIREETRIGSRVVIHNNVVIGSDGFGYAKDEEKHWLKIPQTGFVVIDDDVEIGAGSIIDRPSVGETRIGRGTKIDNLVQVGHSCIIGEDVLLCGQVGLAGSTKVGNRVILAGQVGSAGHLTVGDDAIVTAQAGIGHDVEPGKIVSGSPAFDNRLWLRAVAANKRLGETTRLVSALEKRVAELEAALAANKKESTGESATQAG